MTSLGWYLELRTALMLARYQMRKVTGDQAFVSLEKRGLVKVHAGRPGGSIVVPLVAKIDDSHIVHNRWPRRRSSQVQTSIAMKSLQSNEVK